MQKLQVMGLVEVIREIEESYEEWPGRAIKNKFPLSHGRTKMSSRLFFI
ncbi:hypothetical protein Amico_0356 [Aminobacterium colombiense DSM 12261]|uniref:Uncharacterized protein n=1 Tax=Aminobacterium colombiense (strain DSM 12261 / ALA-1) TaxID=572547 RepID=D5ED67_AMICL|nr:hypothetical protein Amico_0356 [Aminobacterium colombiense DSM 12261]